MAQMPKGQPRSVPDPDSELYDEMIRRERLKQDRFWGPGMGPPPRFDADSIAPADDVATRLQNAPQPRPIVTIGDQAYREVDNGRANVLVPIDDPRVSPADLAERRRGVARVQFMAEHPLGSVGYGLATLANVSPAARDSALIAGGLADATLLGAFPRLGPGMQSKPPSGEPVETRGRPSFRPGEVNERGQAPGGDATITRPLLGTGTGVNRRVRPPGWLGHGREYNQGRGHVFAKGLGGSGKKPRDLVTLEQNGTNHPRMSNFENMVADWVRSGEVVDYFVKPLYANPLLAPTALLLSAYGSRGNAAARVIQNPTRTRK